MRRSALALAVLCATLATACGTTLDVPESPTAEGTQGDNLNVPTTSSSAPAVTPSQPEQPEQPQGPAGTTSTAPTQKGGHAPTGQTSATPGNSAPPVANPSGTGPVRIGVLYVGGATALANALGIKGLSTGDPVAQTKAIASYLNGHGGLAGRPIELSFAAVNASIAQSSVESAYGSACAKLVQDAKVSYVVSYANLSAARLTCYAKAGVTVLDDQSGIPDPSGNAHANTFASPGELALGRAASTLVDDLWRRGWLTSKSKVGTFTWDAPDGHLLVSRFLIPALARHGLKPAASAYTSQGGGAANQGGTVLQFRSRGVDRVIPLAASPLFLMSAAQSQAYHPAYAITSTWGPGALIESSAPKGQLAGAAGIGWDKYLDIGAGKMPGAVSSNETLCFRIMAAAGQGSADRTVRTFQTALCNVMLFLKAVSKRFSLGPETLNLAREARMTFAPADAFAIKLAPGRADGVSAYRDIAYQAGCSCFQYTSGNRPVA